MSREGAARALGSERAEPSLDARSGQPVAAPWLSHLGCDQVAVLCLCASSRGDQKFLAELFLVDRDDTPAALWARAKNAEHALSCAIDQLDNACAVMTIGGALVDAQQCAISHAPQLAWPGAA